MSKYFDLEKLKEMVEAKAETLLDGKQAFLYVSKWLDILPAADVERVRRCKDCSYFSNDGRVTYCNLFGAIMENDDFCSCFEAKMDGKETEQ